MTSQPHGGSAAPRQRFLIGVGVEIVDPQGRLLMIRQERRGEVEWSGVGGTMEADESIADCGLREAREETGLRVRLDRLIRISEFWDEGHFVGVGFLFLAHPDPWPQEVRLPELDGQTRFLEHRWCERDEVASLPGRWHGHITRWAWPTDIRDAVIERIDTPPMDLQE